MSTRTFSAFVICLLALGVVGCTETDVGLVMLETGTLAVTTMTTGTDLDPDGYDFLVDRSVRTSPNEKLGVNESITLPEGYVVGQRTVELKDVASNCTVAGENPRNVEIQQGQTTATSFAIDCVAIPVP